MRVLIFQDRFAALVQIGAKRQTIRATARCKPGDTLSLREWSGRPYRSKQSLLREATCTSVSHVGIGTGGVESNGRVMLFGSPAADDFARADGFADFAEMREWFQGAHGLPFLGELISWEGSR